MKTADQIYNEVEKRWVDESETRKRKRLSRAMEVVLLGVPCGAFVAWAVASGHSIVIGFTSPILAYLFLQLQRSWRLEDRLSRLENPE